MNHEFRKFVDAYTMILTRSEYKDLHVSSLIFPLVHALGFVNHFFLIPYLPAPTVFNIQVKAEMRFHMQQFIVESTTALDRIESNFRTLSSLHGSVTLSRLIKEAFQTTDTLLSEIDLARNNLRPRSISQFLAFLSELPKFSVLDNYSALANRMRTRIQEIQEIIQEYEVDSGKLRNQLRVVRRSFSYTPSFELSTTGLVAIPVPLRPYVPKSPFFLRSETSSAGQSRDGSGIKNYTQNSYIYHYHLENTRTTSRTALRAAVIQMCDESKNFNIISGSLFTICNIWSQAMMMSRLDDDVLSGMQRSWVVEQRKAIRRYKKRQGIDTESVINLVIKVHQDFQHGIPIPDPL